MFFFKKQDEGFIGGTVGYLAELKEEIEKSKPRKKKTLKQGC